MIGLHRLGRNPLPNENLKSVHPVKRIVFVSYAKYGKALKV